MKTGRRLKSVAARGLAGTMGTILAVTVGVVGPAQPASAGLIEDFFEDVIQSIVDIAVGDGTSGQLEAAKQEILAAINGARQDILDHIDATTVAEVRSCTQAAVINLGDMENPPPGFLLGPALNSAVNCATDSVAFFDVVQNPAAADNIGFLMGVIHGLTMAGYVQLGVDPPAGLLANLVQGYESVVVKLRPECTLEVRSNGPPGSYFYTRIYTCTAYNGDSASHYTSCERGVCDNPVDMARLEDRATRNISRGQAQEALPVLRAALAQL